jgi:hypothetical protein
MNLQMPKRSSRRELRRRTNILSLSFSSVVFISSSLIFSLLLIIASYNNNNNNFTAQPPTPIPTQAAASSTTMDTNTSSGIRISYEKGWSIDTRRYPAGDRGVQIAAFYIPDIVNGIPFVYLGIDDLSKGLDRHPITLDEYLREALKYKNSTGFPGFKLLGANTSMNKLSGNSAYIIMWIYKHPSYGLRKSIEIGTIIGNKGYFIDYAAAAEKFFDYLPSVQKMVNSFGIIKNDKVVFSDPIGISTGSIRLLSYHLARVTCGENKCSI